jgi:hypothetical protein
VDHWLDPGIDGLRLDAAEMAPDAFRQRLRAHVRQARTLKVVLVAEAVNEPLQRYVEQGMADAVLDFPKRARFTLANRIDNLPPRRAGAGRCRTKSPRPPASASLGEGRRRPLNGRGSHCSDLGPDPGFPSGVTAAQVRVGNLRIGLTRCTQERSLSQLPMAGVTSFWALPLT